MKKFLLSLLVVLMLALSGCGDATIGVAVDVPIVPVVVVHRPEIVSHSFDMYSYNISGNVVFYARDSPIDFMTVVVYDPSGYEIYRSTTSNDNMGFQGSIPFSIPYKNFLPDYYAYYTSYIYLTDFNGNTSYEVVDTFYVP